MGLAIHLAMTEGQDLGAATMGLGASLFEELIYEGQQLMNGTMLEYRVPRFSDMARSIEMKLVENRDGVGPYGAKGGGFVLWIRLFQVLGLVSDWGRGA